MRPLQFPLLLAAIIIALPATAAAAPNTPTLSPAPTLVQKRQELRQVLGELTRQRLRLRQVKRQERRILGELEGIDRARDEAERRLGELSTELARTQIRAQAAATKLAVSERALERQRATLGGRLRDVYKYGRTGYVDVLLGASDIGELTSRWQFISTIVRADTRLIATYGEEAARYRDLRAQSLADQALLKTLAAQTEARRRDVVFRERQKRSLLTRLQEERTAYERMVNELEENSHELEALIRRSQAGSGNRAGYARALGRFLWPARGTFTSPFGIRRHPIFGIRRMHTGQDIAAPYGSPVAAAADGHVMYMGWFGGYGKIVILDHGEGVSTLYAHLSRILISPDAAVRRGQVIGLVGSTGYSTGPHVHFEIRINGRPIDPARR